jgi:hypothetical protein
MSPGLLMSLDDLGVAVGCDAQRARVAYDGSGASPTFCGLLQGPVPGEHVAVVSSRKTEPVIRAAGWATNRQCRPARRVSVATAAARPNGLIAGSRQAQLD